MEGILVVAQNNSPKPFETRLQIFVFTELFLRLASVGLVHHEDQYWRAVSV